MPYDIYGQPLRPGYCEVHPDIHEEFPCSECLCNRYTPSYPEPTTEDLCGPDHVYHGDDEGGGRCYCGHKRYPRGGPA